MSISKNTCVNVGPSEGLVGEISVPGDKSISHRAVILGSIAEGDTTIHNFLEGADNLTTISAMLLMGVRIEAVVDSTIVIKGVGRDGLNEPTDVIDAENSGTTARLLTGLLSSQPFLTVITGDESLRQRPMKRVVEPLRLMGAEIYGRSGATRLPLAINGTALSAIEYKTPIASAQLKTALLLAGLYARGTTVVEEPLRSRDHTERMLKLFGADVKVDGTKVGLSGGARLIGTELTVPGDLSSAAFFMVGALITPGSDLLIRDVGVNPTRCGVIDVLKKMGGRVEILDTRVVSGEPVADISVKSSRLKGVEIGGEELLRAIDEFPALCVAAAFAEGSSTITGAGELRKKESDRISVISKELTKLGVEIEEDPDGVVINGLGPTGVREPRRTALASHGDHRIAMAMATAGLAARSGVTVEAAACVDVSFPGFFSQLEAVAGTAGT